LTGIAFASFSNGVDFPKPSRSRCTARMSMHIADLRPDRRYAHFVFGVLQSGLTSLVASGFGSLPLVGSNTFLSSWLMAWGLSWLVMLPLVLVAAPFLRKASTLLTRDSHPPS
jgi:hypothetical protein